MPVTKCKYTTSFFVLSMFFSMHSMEYSVSDTLSEILFCIRYDSIEKLEAVLDRPEVDIHDCDEHGWQALHYAVAKGNLDVVKLLVRHGAHVNKETSEEQKILPLDIAIEYNHTKIADYLVELGATRSFSTYYAFLVLLVQGQEREDNSDPGAAADESSQGDSSDSDDYDNIGNRESEKEKKKKHP